MRLGALEYYAQEEVGICRKGLKTTVCGVSSEEENVVWWNKSVYKPNIIELC